MLLQGIPLAPRKTVRACEHLPHRRVTTRHRQGWPSIYVFMRGVLRAVFVDFLVVLLRAGFVAVLLRAGLVVVLLLVDLVAVLLRTGLVAVSALVDTSALT